MISSKAFQLLQSENGRGQVSVGTSFEKALDEPEISSYEEGIHPAEIE
jgi:hypothetical protein